MLMKKILGALTVSFIAFSCQAQQLQIDSLLGWLKNHPAQDTLRVQRLNDLSYLFYQLNPGEGIRYANEGLALAIALHDEKQEGVSLARLGLNYAEQGDYTKALALYKESALIFDKLEDQGRSFSVRNSTAIVYMRLGEYAKALSLYFTNLRMAALKDNKQGFAISAGNIARVYERMQNFDKALDYNAQAIAVQRTLHDEKAVADLLNSRGNILDNMEEPAKAIPFYEESLWISQRLNYQAGVASANANLGNVFGELNRYDSAFLYTRSSFDFYQSMGNKANMAVLLQYLGNLVIRADDALLQAQGIPARNRYPAAIAYFRRSLALNTETEDIEAQAENWQSISDAYKMMQDYQAALQARETYQLLKDSVMNDGQLEAIKQSELQYAVKQNEDSLKLLQQQRDLEIAAELRLQKSRRNTLLWASGLILLSGFVSFIFYKKRVDARQKQARAEFASKVAGTEMKALRAQMNPHFIFNSLNSIGDFMLKNDVPEADRYLSKFSQLMRMILENSEQKYVSLADDLRALKLYIQLEQMRLKGAFAFAIEVDESLDAEDILVPPMILQPFVENSIWHGLAPSPAPGHVSISISMLSNESILCTVEDNGMGRRHSASQQAGEQHAGRSMGMKITEERIHILNQTTDARAGLKLTDLEQGLKVEVTLPLNRRF